MLFEFGVGLEWSVPLLRFCRLFVGHAFRHFNPEERSNALERGSAIAQHCGDRSGVNYAPDFQLAALRIVTTAIVSVHVLTLASERNLVVHVALGYRRWRGRQLRCFGSGEHVRLLGRPKTDAIKRFAAYLYYCRECFNYMAGPVV
jgi:hypothetical protein